MSAQKINKISIEIFMFTIALLILLLSAVNIEGYLKPIKVLGIETSVDTSQQFWQDFLNKNPNYIPGWIEIGRVDKAHEIDPNYLP